MASIKVQRFLIDTSSKYHIEYNRYQSNHVAHGIVALSRLGATKERIKEYIDW